MLSNGNYPTSVYPDNIYPDLESANSNFVVPNESNGFGTSKWIQRLSWLKLKESWFKWFQDSMRWWWQPPNHRTVQRDDHRIAQHFRGDWSPRRSSTIIPSSVHIKLIKHPISMFPMWKFPISTMVSFQVCLICTGEGIKKKKQPFPVRMRRTVPGGSRCKESTKILQIFGTMFGGWY